MKKSDLIKLLDVELFEYHMDLADGEITYSDFNNKIISIIEKAGMLPPAYPSEQEQIARQCRRPANHFSLMERVFLKFEWEPESEDTNELPEV